MYKRKIKKHQEGGEQSAGTSSNFKQFMDKNGANIAAGLSAVSSAFQYDSADPEATAIGNGIGDAVGTIFPMAKPFIEGAKVIDGIFRSAGIGWDTLDRDAAKRAGVKGVGFQNALASIPGNSVFGLMMGKTTNATDYSQNYSKMTDFSGSRNDLQAAQKLSGTRSLNTGRINQFISHANWIGAETDKLLKFNEKRQNNYASQDLAAQNINRFSGTNSVLNIKNGMKFPELDEARNILQSILSSKIEKHQTGGIIGESSNIIPSGSLHKNLHHLEEINPELEGQITKKGIPVVSIGEGGEISQSAEIETGELTMEISASKQLETFYEQYNQTEDKDAIAIECGKFLVDQILRNTQDNVGLINEVKV